MSVEAMHSVQTPYLGTGVFGTALKGLLVTMEYVAGLALAIDVGVVFLSVICRYFLQQPLDWAEEIARALMVVIVFFGAGTVLARSKHAGIDVFRGLLPARLRPALVQICCWIVACVAVGLAWTSLQMAIETAGDTTPLGFSQTIYTVPVVVGSLALTLFAVANAFEGPLPLVWKTLVIGAVVAGLVWALNQALPDSPVTPIRLLVGGFVLSVVIGVPIAFALAFSAMLYFLADPSLPMVIYSQQTVAGTDHFVLLAIPFFVLAGLCMEANGMSTRLVELLLRMLGRMRGGFNLIIILSTALFSGISGSKLADIAAVGSIVMPAVRRTRQDPNDAASLLACTAVMSETIPPCVNMIIFAFVANVSVGGLFMAGVVPAIVLALCLAAVAIWYGQKVDPSEAFPVRRSLPRLIGGSLIAIVMIFMIGRGVSAGVATSTEVSAFAVVYALLVGGLAFRELSVKSVVRLFVDSASMAGGILFIVAAASSFAFALTIEQIPTALSHTLIAFAQSYGALSFLLLTSVLMIIFGAVLEGAPALIIFGPLLTPIALQLGVNPLHFGTVMVLSMGLGLFAPPIGLGLFATCAITNTRVQDVARPMVKYLLVLALGIACIIAFPVFSLWLPTHLGLN